MFVGWDLAVFPKFRFQCCLRGNRFVIRVHNSSDTGELWHLLLRVFEWCLWISGARIRQSWPEIAAGVRRLGLPLGLARVRWGSPGFAWVRQSSPEFARVRRSSPGSADDTIARTDDQRKADARIVREMDKNATTTVDGTIMSVVREVSVHMDYV